MNPVRRPLMAGLSLLIFLAGCSTRGSFKAGDAVVHEKRVRASPLASAPQFFRVELPRVPLAEAREFHFTIRHSPKAIQLTHLFMSLPQGDGHENQKSASTSPWENAVVTWVFTEPTGELIHSNRYRLGGLKWEFSQGDLKLKPWRHADRLRGWYAWSDLDDLKAKLGTRSNYDAVVSVVVPSPRKGDFIQLRGEDVPNWPGPEK